MYNKLLVDKPVFLGLNSLHAYTYVAILCGSICTSLTDCVSKLCVWYGVEGPSFTVQQRADKCTTDGRCVTKY